MPDRQIRAQGKGVHAWLLQHGQPYINRWRIITIAAAALGALADRLDSLALMLLALPILLYGGWQWSKLRQQLNEARRQREGGGGPG